MPSDAVLKTMNTIHRAMLKVSFGRIGWTASRMPVLELTTIGRKSGRAHTVMLTSPVREGTTFVVVASRGGDDKPPAWLLNLVAQPDVQVSVQGGPKRQLQARVATDEERARLWPQVTADHRNYAEYQTRTTRTIPLVMLEQSDPPAR